MAFEIITITFKVDRDSLNKALGNTPNATLRQGMEELLDAAFSQANSYCPNCDYQRPERIKGHWHFPD